MRDATRKGPSQLLSYIDAHPDAFIARLAEAVAIPSLSGDCAFRKNVQQMSDRCWGGCTCCSGTRSARGAAGEPDVLLRAEGEREYRACLLLSSFAFSFPCTYTYTDTGVVQSDNYGSARACARAHVQLARPRVFQATVSGPARDLHSGVFGRTIADDGPCHTHGRLASSSRASTTWYLWRMRRSGACPSIWVFSPTYVFEDSAIYDKLDYSIADVEVRRVQVLMGRMRLPSFSLHGIEGAFAGPGAKTVIPAEVGGKFSIRFSPLHALRFFISPSSSLPLPLVVFLVLRVPIPFFIALPSTAPHFFPPFLALLLFIAASSSRLPTLHLPVFFSSSSPFPPLLFHSFSLFHTVSSLPLFPSRQY
ncbi:hypothetical protein FB451DRAFT_1393808 [Mycena latifolia]|nr:hypothetical protein FB451DRAFT_1393808 [Mycena latifolia]